MTDRLVSQIVHTLNKLRNAGIWRIPTLNGGNERAKNTAAVIDKSQG